MPLTSIIDSFRAEYLRYKALAEAAKRYKKRSK